MLLGGSGFGLARARALSAQSPSSTWKNATTVAFDDACPGGGGASIAVAIADLRSGPRRSGFGSPGRPRYWNAPSAPPLARASALNVVQTGLASEASRRRSTWKKSVDARRRVRARRRSQSPLARTAPVAVLGACHARASEGGQSWMRPRIGAATPSRSTTGWPGAPNVSAYHAIDPRVATASAPRYARRSAAIRTGPSDAGSVTFAGHPPRRRRARRRTPSVQADGAPAGRVISCEAGERRHAGGACSRSAQHAAPLCDVAFEGGGAEQPRIHVARAGDLHLGAPCDQTSVNGGASAHHGVLGQPRRGVRAKGRRATATSELARRARLGLVRHVRRDRVDRSRVGATPLPAML